MREHRAFARVATTEQEESAQAPLVRRSERGTSDPPPPHPAPPSKQTDEYQSASSPSTQHEKPRDILLLLLLLLSSQVPPVEPAAATTAPVCCAPTPAPARRQQQRRLQDAPVRLVVVCAICPAERPCSFVETTRAEGKRSLVSRAKGFDPLSLAESRVPKGCPQNFVFSVSIPFDWFVGRALGRVRRLSLRVCSVNARRRERARRPSVWHQRLQEGLRGEEPCVVEGAAPRCAEPAHRAGKRG